MAAAQDSVSLAQMSDLLRRLASTGKDVEKTFKTMLKKRHNIDVSTLSLEFGLTGLVKSALAKRQLPSSEDVIWFDLWERFVRFEEALRIIKRSFDGVTEQPLTEAENKLERLKQVVSDICSTISKRTLKAAGIDVEKKSFNSLDQDLMKVTVRYVNADKENSSDLVDSGNEHRLAVDLRNYTIICELVSMTTVFATAISQVFDIRGRSGKNS